MRERGVCVRAPQRTNAQDYTQAHAGTEEDECRAKRLTGN